MDADFIQWLKKVRENLDISPSEKPCEQYDSTYIPSRVSSSRDFYTILISSANGYIVV